MSEEIRVGVPEDLLEAEDHLVEVAEAEALDSGGLPLWQWWGEVDGVELSMVAGWWTHC